jgi:hypothetical protein
MMQRLAATLARNSVRRQVIHKMDHHTVRMSIKTLYEEPPEKTLTHIRAG